jgi:hypothetical protein
MEKKYEEEEEDMMMIMALFVPISSTLRTTRFGQISGP